MADDENGKAEREKIADHTPANHAPVTGTTRTPAIGAIEAERQSEWTASDARGPLSEASDHASPLAIAGTTTAGDHATHAAVTASEDGSAVIPLSTGDEVLSSADPHAAPGPETTDPEITEPKTTEPETTEPETKASKTTEPTVPVATAPPRRSAWPIAAGIVIGAIIGAGSSAGFFYGMRNDAGKEAANAPADKQIAALSARIDSLQSKPDPQPAIAALKTSVADLQGKVTSVQKSLGVQASTETTVEKSVEKTAAKPAFDPAPLQQKIDALQASLDAVKKEGADGKALDGKLAALVTVVETLKSQGTDLQKQSATTKASLDTLQTKQTTLEGKVTTSPALAVVADSLVAQIDRGEPYASQADALTGLGADPAKIAVLKQNAEKGVPSAKALAVKFEPLVDPMIATEHHTSPNAGFLDRLKSGMSGLVSIRREGDTSGDDIASHVAAIQADLAHDDVGAAYKAWTALPAAAKAKSEGWGALAKTHAEAMGAARALQAQAIAALGAKKS